MVLKRHYIYYLVFLCSLIFACCGGGASSGSSISPNQASLNLAIDTTANLMASGDYDGLINQLHPFASPDFSGSVKEISIDVLMDIGKELKALPKQKISDTQSFSLCTVAILANDLGEKAHVTIEFRKDENGQWKVFDMY